MRPSVRSPGVTRLARRLLGVLLVAPALVGVAACSAERPVLRPADRVPTTTTTAVIEGFGSTSTSEEAVGQDPRQATPTPTPTPAPAPAAGDGTSLVATVLDDRAEVEVFDDPGAAAARTRVENPGEYGQAQVFLVLDRRPGWLRVVLPVRPNGSTGWVREGDVTLTRHRYRIDVSLSRHRIEVYDGDERIVDAPAGIGTTDTPTPGGTYYTWVLIDPSNSGYGAYAYGLNGFSDVLDRFGGGDGRLGIHGTTDESTVGRDVSHGCIRVTDAVITQLVEAIGLPLGVPVTVTP